MSEKKKELIKKIKCGISNNFTYGNLALNWLYEQDFLDRKVLTTYIINDEQFLTDKYTSEEILNKLLDILNENDLENMLYLLNQGVVNKEKAKEVIYTNFDGYADGSEVWDEAMCPTCEREFEMDYEEHYKYCPNCGQKLKW